jgi:hypothetical protein
MKKLSRAGICGILDQILSTDTRPPLLRGDLAAVAESTTSPPSDEHRHDDPAVQARSKTRRGRPPGNTRRPKEPKEKVTVWITGSLIGRYRDWTWDARCQLSHLIERALTDYHERNHSRRLRGQ